MEKVRTINQVADEFIKRDPDTAITKYFIRNLVNEGKVPVIKSGNRSLITVESIERYINSVFRGAGNE